MISSNLWSPSRRVCVPVSPSHFCLRNRRDWLPYGLSLVTQADFPAVSGFGFCTQQALSILHLQKRRHMASLFPVLSDDIFATLPPYQWQDNPLFTLHSPVPLLYPATAFQHPVIYLYPPPYTIPLQFLHDLLKGLYLAGIQQHPFQCFHTPAIYSPVVGHKNHALR